MRKITMWLAGTAAVVALLFNYRTSTMGPARPSSIAAASGGTPGIVAVPQPDNSGPSGNGNQPPSPGPGAGSSGAASPPPSAGAVSKSGSDLVVNGSAVGTLWGPVQVQVHISNHRITDVTALQAPGGISRELSELAVPRLRSWTLAAQSADIDVVSGATQTSESYRTSLQAALDAAQFRGGR